MYWCVILWNGNGIYSAHNYRNTEVQIGNTTIKFKRGFCAKHYAGTNPAKYAIVCASSPGKK